MDHDEIGAAMSEVLGARISYAPLSIDEFRRRMEQTYKFNPFLVQHLCEVAQDYQNGVFSGTNDAVEKITGEAPLSVPDFIARNRRAFV
jgi:hypothetical protein